MTITYQKCPCGQQGCRVYQLVGIGSFYQGSGFTQAEAQRIVSALNSGVPWAPTHRHYKGGLYRWCWAHRWTGNDANNGRWVVRYDDADGECYVMFQDQWLETVTIAGAQVRRYAPIEGESIA